MSVYSWSWYEDAELLKLKHCRCSYRPDLESRHQYYDHIYDVVWNVDSQTFYKNSAKHNEIDQFVMNRNMMEYFVNDCKNAIEQKLPGFGKCLRLMEHPFIICYYLNRGIDLQFHCTKEHIDSIIKLKGQINILAMRTLFKMGFRKHLYHIKYKSEDYTSTDMLFLNKILRTNIPK